MFIRISAKFGFQLSIYPSQHLSVNCPSSVKNLLRSVYTQRERERVQREQTKCSLADPTYWTRHYRLMCRGIHPLEVEGIEYTSLTVTSFNLRKSRHHLADLSRFLINTGAEAHSEVDGSITPVSNIFCRFSNISLRKMSTEVSDLSQ